MTWGEGCRGLGERVPVVGTKAFSSQAVLLEPASKPQESLRGEMDLALALNFSAAAEHCCSPSHGSCPFSPACFWKYCVTK